MANEQEPNDGYYQQMIDNAVKRIEELEREVERWQNDAILAMKNEERNEARQEVERLRSALINISEWYAMPSDELADYARLTLSSKPEQPATGGRCPHWDCGWCFEPNTNRQNGCVGSVNCETFRATVTA